MSYNECFVGDSCLISAQNWPHLLSRHPPPRRSEFPSSDLLPPALTYSHFGTFVILTGIKVQITAQSTNHNPGFRGYLHFYPGQHDKPPDVKSIGAGEYSLRGRITDAFSCSMHHSGISNISALFLRRPLLKDTSPGS